MCQQTGFPPICNSPTNRPHTCMPCTNSHSDNLSSVEGLGFYLLISEVWRASCKLAPSVRWMSRRRRLTLQFLPLSQPNRSSSENTHQEMGSCTWVHLQHSNIFCLLPSLTQTNSAVGSLCCTLRAQVSKRYQICTEQCIKHRIIPLWWLMQPKTSKILMFFGKNHMKGLTSSASPTLTVWWVITVSLKILVTIQKFPNILNISI